MPLRHMPCSRLGSSRQGSNRHDSRAAAGTLGQAWIADLGGSLHEAVWRSGSAVHWCAQVVRGCGQRCKGAGGAVRRPVVRKGEDGGAVGRVDGTEIHGGGVTLCAGLHQPVNHLPISSSDRCRLSCKRTFGSANFTFQHCLCCWHPSTQQASPLHDPRHPLGQACACRQ